MARLHAADAADHHPHSYAEASSEGLAVPHVVGASSYDNLVAMSGPLQQAEVRVANPAARRRPLAGTARGASDRVRLLSWALWDLGRGPSAGSRLLAASCVRRPPPGRCAARPAHRTRGTAVAQGPTAATHRPPPAAPACRCPSRGCASRRRPLRRPTAATPRPPAAWTSLRRCCRPTRWRACRCCRPAPHPPLPRAWRPGCWAQAPRPTPQRLRRLTPARPTTHTARWAA